MESAPRTMSSPATFFLKFLLPVAIGVLFGAVALLMFLSPRMWGPRLDPEVKLWFLGGAILGAAFVWGLYGSLKRVRMDDTNLYVSNYSKELTIPLTEVSQVTRRWQFKVNTVTIELRSATVFGAVIEFLPHPGWALFWGAPEVAQEIRDAVALAAGRASGEAGL